MGQDGTELAQLDAAWRGWRLAGGELVSPEGWRFTPGAVRAGELYRRRIAELGERDRADRAALEVDPVNRAGVQRLAVLHSALEAAAHALEDITSRLSADERRRLFCESPAPAAPTSWRRFLRGLTEDRESPGLLLELVDPRVGPVGLGVDTLQPLAERRPRDAPGERAADEREEDALAQAHSGAPFTGA